MHSIVRTANRRRPLEIGRGIIICRVRWTLRIYSNYYASRVAHFLFLQAFRQTIIIRAGALLFAVNRHWKTLNRNNALHLTLIWTLGKIQDQFPLLLIAYFSQCLILIKCDSFKVQFPLLLIEYLSHCLILNKGDSFISKIM